MIPKNTTRIPPIVAPTPTLGMKTLDYWNTSCILHGKPCPVTKLTTGAALELCSSNLAVLDPNRPLAKRFNVMLARIIDGRAKAGPKQAATVLQLPERAAQ